MTTKRQRTPYRSMSGVAAILGKDEAKAISTSKNTLPIENICLPPQQPRRYFDPAKMQELSQSIKEHGILEPLIVRPLPDNRFELVAGERRYRAAKNTDLIEVPIVVRELSDEQALQLALVENLQREDLNPVEETEAILQLLSLQLKITTKDAVSLLHRMQNEAKGKVTRNVTGNEKAEAVQLLFEGLSIGWQSFVRNRLPLLKLPEEVLNVLRQGKLEYTKAKAIAQITDKQKRSKLLKATIDENLPLSEIKSRIKILKKSSKKPERQEEKAIISLKSTVRKTYQTITKTHRFSKDPELQDQVEQLFNTFIYSLDKLIEEDTEEFYE